MNANRRLRLVALAAAAALQGAVHGSALRGGRGGGLARSERPVREEEEEEPQQRGERGLQKFLPNQTCYWPNGTEAVNCTGFYGTCGGMIGGYGKHGYVLIEASVVCGEQSGAAYTVWMESGLWIFQCCTPSETEVEAEPVPEPHRELQWLPNQTCYWSNGIEVANCTGFNGPCWAVPGGYTSFGEALSMTSAFCGDQMGDAYTVWMANGMRDPWLGECCTPAETEDEAEPIPEPHRELQWLPNQTCYGSNGIEVVNCTGFNGPCWAVPGSYTSLGEALSMASAFCGEQMGDAYTVWMANGTRDPWQFECCAPTETEHEAEPIPEPHRELQWLSNQTCYWSNGTVAVGCPGFLESGTCINSVGCAASEAEAYSSANKTCGDVYKEAFTVWLTKWPADCPWHYICCYHVGGGSAAGLAGTEGGGAGIAVAGSTRSEPGPGRQRELQSLPNQTCYSRSGDEVQDCAGFADHCGSNPDCAASQLGVYNMAKTICAGAFGEAYTVWFDEGHSDCQWLFKCCSIPLAGSAEAAAGSEEGAGITAARGGPDRDHQRALQQWLPNQTCYWSNGSEAVGCPGFNGTCWVSAGFAETLSKAKVEAYEYCGEDLEEAFAVWLDGVEPNRPWRFTCCSPPGGSTAGSGGWAGSAA
jgi:hypothetical protein